MGNFIESDSVLRTDILSSDITEDQQHIKVIAQTQFQYEVQNARSIDRTTTPGPSKNIVEVMELIRQAIIDYESRTNVNQDAKVHLTYEKPDREAELEAISISLAVREPGMYSQGRPGEGKIKNRRPVLREHVDDPDNPGYKRAVLGYFYDNTLRLTCWARTSKQANLRALWLEDVMEEYTWFFVYSGVNRIFYDRRREEITHEVEGNKIYGRPIDYFVRTEKLRNVSQKTLEEIVVNLTTRVTNI